MKTVPTKIEHIVVNYGETFKNGADSYSENNITCNICCQYEVIESAIANKKQVTAFLNKHKKCSNEKAQKVIEYKTALDSMPVANVIKMLKDSPDKTRLHIGINDTVFINNKYNNYVLEIVNKQVGEMNLLVLRVVATSNPV